MAELVLPLLLVGATILLLLRASRGAGRAPFAVAALILGAALPGFWRPRAPVPPEEWPGRAPVSEYVTSATCRSCHPGEHASWQRTFHRTMTQAARADRVRGLGAAGAVRLQLDGASWALGTRGDEVWASLPGEPDQELLLTTGSHHYQGHWLAGQRAGDLRMFPFVYVFREARWLPRRDVFLQPPDAPGNDVHWSSNCIQCHATAGRPGHDPMVDRFDTEVAELGIACEACHGPGDEHVRRHKEPLERYVAHGKADPSIVNPARLARERASMVCGQCHSYSYPRDEEDFWTNGYAKSYRAGDDLAAGRVLLTPDALAQPGAPRIEADVESLYWPDGTIRVGGREYNGLVASACFLRGEGERRLACESCHSMHRAPPEGQLAPEREGDEACMQCHGDMRDKVAAHTHHRVESPGSRCVGCHMPRTTYALLKSIRSHRIDSPDMRTSIQSGRPTACTLCHLDRTLAWTDGWLHDWYGRPRALPPASEEEVAAGPAWLLGGNAAQRVILAAAMGDDDALLASGAGWAAPFLARALTDPYAAVRIVAYRSLLKQPDFESAAFDPEAPPEARARAAEEIVLRWEKLHSRPFDRWLADALVAERDDRRITISE